MICLVDLVASPSQHLKHNSKLLQMVVDFLTTCWIYLAATMFLRSSLKPSPNQQSMH